MVDVADGFYIIMYNENVLSPVMDDSRSSLGNKSLFSFFVLHCNYLFWNIRCLSKPRAQPNYYMSDVT